MKLFILINLKKILKQGKDINKLLDVVDKLACGEKYVNDTIRMYKNGKITMYKIVHKKYPI